MSGLQRRFVDRDVRDNPHLINAAEAYLDSYTGEFTYLTEMRARRMRGLGLTDAMIRGVLNCMAGDPRVTISVVEEQSTSAYGNVVDFKRPDKSQNIPCPLFANGIFHSHKKSHLLRKAGFGYCEGLYRLNRKYFTAKATIKTPYIVAAQGGVVHKADPNAHVAWYPRHHALGYMMPASLMGRGVCGTQWFREPRLIDTLLMVSDWRPTHQGSYLRTCKRCFEGDYQ